MPTDTLEGIETGIAVYLDESRLDEPGYLSEQEARLMQGVEDRRRFEQWHRGVPMLAEHRGFTREREPRGLRLELRAQLREEQSNDGANVVDGKGNLRRWPGPGSERRLGKLLDQLPLAAG